MNAPLTGLKVVDLSSSYAGPTATMYLADMGADVLKVEPPAGDDSRLWGPPFVDGESAWFHSCNRNKRTVSIDIRTADGQAELDRLLAAADVLIVSLRPSKLAELGLAPDEVRRRHPRLIYCAVSGFGLTGPQADLAGYDLTAQARSGMMSVTGAKGGPPQRMSTAVCDVVAGTIAAFAISSAVVRQQRDGSGELIDVSLLEAGMSLMAPRLASYLAGDPEPAPSGASDSVLAIYEPFETQDRPIVAAVGNDGMWVRFCAAIGAEDLVREGTADNASRRLIRGELVARINERTRTGTSAHWLERLAAAGVPAALVQSLSEVVADPQVVARECIVELDNGIRVFGSPWRLGQDGARMPLRAMGPVGADADYAEREWELAQ